MITRNTAAQTANTVKTKMEGRCAEGLPKSEDVSQLQESGVDQNGKGVLLEELGEKDHRFTLLPKLARS